MVKVGLIACALTIFAAAQTPPETLDPRLSIHTLVREDIFAGVLSDDAERLSRGEKNVDRLLESRQGDRAPLLAWKGEIALYRAVVAHEQKRESEWDAQFKRALDFFAEAKRLAAEDVGVNAVTGGSWLIFINRVPEPYRPAANAAAYDAYHAILNVQGKFLEHLPMHMKGEVLSGLAESAQRTGRAEEATKYLSQIVAQLPGTPYASRANAWLKDPDLANRGHVTCQSCHEPGRLAATKATLAK